MKELVAIRCSKCGHVMYPRHARCLRCRSREFEEIEAQGDARLVTFTENRALPWGIEERCRFLGIVEFANSVRATGWLKVEHPEIGMILRARWAPVRAVGGKDVYGLVLEA